MARKRTKLTKATRRPKLTSALSQTALDAGLDQLSAEELQDLLHQSRSRIYYWMGDPTEQSLLSLRDMHPLLSKIIDFDTVLARLSSLEKFDRGTFGVHISSFFPELVTVRDRCLERVHQLPAGVAKAEGWLKPIAKEAGADADLEAAIYFASRGPPHFGLVLAGGKLVNNPEFKSGLLREFPNAIGGEMEGAGLWAAADRNSTEWVLAKAVCDWADGCKHDKYQEMASAVSLCHHVFSDPHALDGL
jgi:hypothetical protein